MLSGELRRRAHAVVSVLIPLSRVGYGRGARELARVRANIFYGKHSSSNSFSFDNRAKLYFQATQHKSQVQPWYRRLSGILTSNGSSTAPRRAVSVTP